MKKHLGKIAIIVLPLIAIGILLYPTYNASRLEGLESKARARASRAGSPDDSARIMDNFYKEYGSSLNDARKGRLKLGLDLRGGMYVTMEVDIVKLIQESAELESIDEIFNEVLDKTHDDLASSDADAIDVFLKNFDAIARPKGKTLLNYFETSDFRDMTEEAIIKKLRNNSDQAIDQAQEVIRQRIDQYGVSEPNIQKSGARRIVLELPGVQKREEMKSLLQTTARLEFNLVRNNEVIVRTFAKIDKYLSNLEKKKKGQVVAEEPVTDTTAIVDVASADNAKAADTANVASGDTNKKEEAKDAKETDTNNPYAGLPEEEQKKRYTEDHPFTSLFGTYYWQGQGDRQQMVNYGYIGDAPEGEYTFRISKESMDKFNAILNREDIKKLIPIDLTIAIDAKPDARLLKQNVEVYDFYCLKKQPELTGDVITDARATTDPTNGQNMVTMAMNADGADNWGRITGANLHKRIAIVLDDRVYSAPTVQSKITGGNSQITGSSTYEEAKLLEIVLKAGALKAPVKIVEERIVGPSLGEDSINSGLWATIGAAILVILFMLIYYHTAGLTADIAVIINVGLVLATLAALGGTLTLPGIAGIILTMGMAVDANVLIYERIREELARGRSVRSAVDEGFSKAMPAIIDTNVTTFIAGLVLYYIGTGPIQGFAITLIIGIIGTLFTGIFVTKAVMNLIMSKTNTMSFGQPKLKENK